MIKVWTTSIFFPPIRRGRSAQRHAHRVPTRSHTLREETALIASGHALQPTRQEEHMFFRVRRATAAALTIPVLVVGCSAQKQVSFSRDVHPVLQQYCLECHATGGKGHAASGFSVESYDDVMRGTKFGPVIVPGSSVSSTLARLIEHKADPSINMPQGKPRLPKEKLDIIRAWIDEGAKNN